MRLQPEINLSWCIPFIPLFGEQFEERGKNSRNVFSETTQHHCSFLIGANRLAANGSVITTTFPRRVGSAHLGTG